MKNDDLKAWRARLSLGEAGMAAYLGVPVTTYRKWENGTRSQDASTERLFEVLQLLDGGLYVTCRQMHDELLEPARVAGAADDKPKRKPGRPPRQAPLAPIPMAPPGQQSEVPMWLRMQNGAG